MGIVRLKGDRSVLIRRLLPEDRERLLTMYSSLSAEAIRWGMPPYDKTVVDKWLSNLRNEIALVAIYDDRIIGHAQIYKFPHKRRKGLGDLLIYVHQDFQNKGLGTRMLGKLLKDARRQKLHRLTLDVVADNEAAIHLYERMGFKIEGVSKESYFGEDEKYYDLLTMGIIL